MAQPCCGWDTTRCRLRSLLGTDLWAKEVVDTRIGEPCFRCGIGPVRKAEAVAGGAEDASLRVTQGCYDAYGCRDRHLRPTRHDTTISGQEQRVVVAHCRRTSRSLVGVGEALARLDRGEIPDERINLQTATLGRFANQAELRGEGVPQLQILPGSTSTIGDDQLDGKGLVRGNPAWYQLTHLQRLVNLELVRTQVGVRTTKGSGQPVSIAGSGTSWHGSLVDGYRVGAQPIVVGGRVVKLSGCRACIE